MHKINRALLPLCVVSALANAETITYQSIANELTLHNDGIVKVKVLLVEDSDEISCSETSYDFNFNIDSIVAQKWYDTLLLSRNTNSLVDFIYENSNCSLTAIKLPKLYEHGSNVGQSGKQLKETGEFANTALIGTNVLSAENYSSSAHYGQDIAAAAFDGYVYSSKMNTDAVDKIGRGIWLHKKSNEAESNTTPWIQVDFNKSVTLTGLAIFINEQALELGRSPRNTTLYTSLDGIEYKEIEELTFSFVSPAAINFSTPITSRFFRLVIETNYGDRNFIEIDELEFYQ